MNSIFTRAVIMSIKNYAYGGLSSGVGIIVIVLIVLLMVEVIFFETAAQSWKDKKLRAFDFAIAPLLFILVVMALVRFAQFMNLI